MQLTNAQVLVIRALSHAHSAGTLYPTAEIVTRNLNPDPSRLIDLPVSIVRSALHNLNGEGVVAVAKDGYRLMDGMVAILAPSAVRACNLCIDGSDAIADVKIPGDGRWANVCLQHFNDRDCHLGLGLGQIYVWER